MGKHEADPISPGVYGDGADIESTPIYDKLVEEHQEATNNKASFSSLPPSPERASFVDQVVCTARQIGSAALRFLGPPLHQ